MSGLQAWDRMRIRPLLSAPRPPTPAWPPAAQSGRAVSAPVQPVWAESASVEQRVAPWVAPLQAGSRSVAVGAEARPESGAPRPGSRQGWASRPSCSALCPAARRLPAPTAAETVAGKPALAAVGLAEPEARHDSRPQTSKRAQQMAEGSTVGRAAVRA
jgi:hypothetical protein